MSAQIEYLPTASNPANDSRVSKYTFDPPGVSNAVTENTFDDFKRLVSKKYTLGGNVINRSYTYNNSRVTKCVDKSTVYYIGTNDYTYDAMGRIKTDNHSGKYAPSNYRSYEYDEYGQLQRENNQGLAKTFMYEYNGIGNLTAIKEYALSLSTTPAGTPVTTTFGYTDDRLTSFGGTTISYNAMGCPTSYDGKIATWAEGKLSRLSQGSKITGMSTYNYGYNGYGQRISRSYSYAAGTSGTGAAQLGQLTACSRKYYYDHAGRLIAEDVTKTYYGEGTTTENIVFLYDESGIIGMELTIGGTTNLYYFQRNLQGDVVSIYDPSGTLKAHYLYDAWDNCTIASETTSYDVANANPIRYRGYYYDDDTGLYYCNARYYSPKWRRFISPDDTSYLDPESVNGLNLYCYCNNNPIMFIDALGNSCVPVCTLIWALGAVVVGYQLFRLNLYRENYASNSAIDGDPSTSTHNQLIHAQNDAIIRSFMYGKRHAWWNACETIAIHNAKVLLGIDSTLSQTMLDCQNAGIMIGDGQFGSNPFFIGIVLGKHDISYSLVSREGMTKPGVYIISYWNKAWYKSGLHTIAVHYDGSQYIAYNVGSNEKNGIPIDPSDYRWRFIIGYYLGG